MKYIIIYLFACFTIVSCENAATETVDQPTKAIQKQSVVFIAGLDEDDNTFYEHAKAHFSQQNFTIVEDLQSLEAIILWLNKHAEDKSYDQIHIVSQRHPWLGMALTTFDGGGRITASSLHSDTLPKPKQGITEKTDIIFHASGLGTDNDMMKGLKGIFSSDISPRLYASKYVTIFGGKYASHYLAEPFYVFYPTGHSPGNTTLSKELSLKYENANLDWLTAMDTREETTPGAIYSYRFDVPIFWEIVFEDASEIPKLENKEAILDYILETDKLSFDLYELGIPMAKFRWTSSSDGNTLKIEGKTTVLTVLMPLMNNYDPAEYTVPDIAHSRLYSRF